MGINWRYRITNEAVKQKIRDLIGEYEALLEVASWWKLQWFGHTTRRTGLLANDVMVSWKVQEGEEGQKNVAHRHCRMGGIIQHV